MRNDPHNRSAVQVIEDHYHKLLHHTSMTKSSFMMSVREHYEANVAPGYRAVKFSQSDIAGGRDAETFDRFLDPDSTVRLPMELIEAILAAFPAEERFALQTELASRQGMLAVHMPVEGNSEDTANLARLAKETGEAMIAISKLLEDGKIDHNDRAHAPEALNEIEQAMSCLAEIHQRVIDETGIRESTVVPIGNGAA